MPRIPDAVIAEIKQTVDLVSVIKSRGINLRKVGPAYQGCCPFHEDSTPSFSVTPGENLWRCFGCDKGGDAIRFVELHDQVDFRQAVQRLSDCSLTAKTKAVKKKTTTAKSEPASIPPALRRELLGRVAAFYHQCFLDQAAAQDYLRGRGFISLVTLAKPYQLGYADGSLLETLPQDAERRDHFKTLGILTAKEREFFHGCLVFPLLASDGSGQVVNLYGRRLSDSAVNHLYLPGPRQGLWNAAVARSNPHLLLTESILDAFSLVDKGLQDVIPCYGTNGFTDELLIHLHTHNVKELTLCFDADDAGRAGADKLAQRLREEGFTAYIAELPDGLDVNSYLQQHSIADFQRLLHAAWKKHRDNPSPMPPKPPKPPTPTTKNDTPSDLQPTTHGFILSRRQGTRARHYELKALSRHSTQLKATVKAYGDRSSGFELHTLDLYSARSRAAFAQACAALFQVDLSLTQTDLAALLEHIEAWQPESDSKPQPATPLTAAEQKAALAFLKTKKLANAIITDLTTLGVEGERLNKLLAYLTTVSRKLDDPLSLLIQSRSAAGKSTLQNAVLRLIPETDKVVYTRMTDQALFYQDENALAHKVLALEEAEGLGGAAYSLRALQSSKTLTIATTRNDPQSGKMTTEHYRVHGPVAVLVTTTAASLDEETLSRFLTVTIDESEAMTQQIHQAQRYNDTLAGYQQKLNRDAITAKHHHAQQLLEPLAVINPYAPQLQFPSHSLRARRDHQKYLQLIKAVAFLHQRQREISTLETTGSESVRYISVAKTDIALANTLAEHVLGGGLEELSAPARRLLGLIHAMVRAHCQQQNLNAERYHFSRKTVRDYSGWSEWQVRQHMQELVELEYVKSRIGTWGREYVYSLDYQGRDEDGSGLLLTDPATLEEPAVIG